MASAIPPWPSWWRWGALAFLAIWAPTYAIYWGWRNFFALCDVAVALTCLGLLIGSRRMLSAQALLAIPAGLLWLVDVASRAMMGRHLFGGTEYMWKAEIPLPVRALSLFHVALPLVLIAVLRRCGYDRRGLALQTAITAALLVAARPFAAGKNLNYVLTDPLFHHSWGPPVVHLGAVLVGIAVLLYLPTHFALARKLSRASAP